MTEIHGGGKGLPQISAAIIHLPRASARAAQAEKLRAQLAALPDIEGAAILPAIDAQELDPAQIAAVYRRKIFMPFYPFPLKAAEIACFLSHRAAWAALLASKAEAAFIAEDDMRPRTGFAEGFALAAENISQCGLIRFPHRDREKGKLIAASGNIKLIRPAVVSFGTVAYMLSRAAAEKLLQQTQHFDRPLDVFLQMFWISGVRPAALIPGGIAEISAKLGGSTLTQKRELAAKLQHELMRPLYRLQIRLLSWLKADKT